MQSFWGINKSNLSKSISESPHGILKAQIDEFEKITNSILIAKMNHIRLDNEYIEYSLGTSFEIVAPMLDKYKYTLFTIYTKPESNYPVLIYLNNTHDPESVNSINADYKCDNETEFIEVLKEILGSPNTTEIIQTLYSKSNL